MHISFPLLIAIGSLLSGAFGGALGAVAAWLAGKLGGKPSAATVRAAGAAGALSFAVIGAFAASRLIGASIEAQIDAQNPDVALLHRYDPTDYEKIVSIIRSSSPASAQAQSLVHQVVLDSMSKRTKQLDDSSLTREFSLMVTEAKYLRDRDPTSCLRVWSGDDVSSVTTPAMNVESDELDEALFRQGLERPAAPAVPLLADKRQALVRNALDGLPSNEKELILPLLLKSTKPTTPAETRAMCDYYIGYFGGALASPNGTLRGLVALSPD